MNENKLNTIALPNFKNYGHLLYSDEMRELRKLFVRQGSIIERFSLFGRQMLGRLQSGSASDISIMNPFVSRDHGFFETTGEQTFYTASDSTNGIYLNGLRIAPGERVSLHDGDELTIPNSLYMESENHIMLICAFSEYKINLWNSVMEAQFDPLTGLPNRKLFTEWFNIEIANSGQKDLWFFLLDIDRFKSINDEYGHAAGDEALRVLSDVLKKTVISINHTGRWGGDEFVGVLKGSADEAAGILEHMNRVVSSVYVFEKFYIYLSIGLCRINSASDSDNLDTLLARADGALYRAKEAGRNRVVMETA